MVARVIVEENISFFSEHLLLEGVLSYDQNLSRGAGVVLCAPHPHLGGDMDNNVITALHRLLPARGYICLRFNYRGVGKSHLPGSSSQREGLKTFWEESWSPEDEMKIQDVTSAIAYMHQVEGVMHDRIFLVGYSFGAYLALQAVRHCPMIQALVLIAPTIHFHDYTPLNLAPLAKLVIGSDNDFSYSLQQLLTIFEDFSPPKSLQIIAGGDHFFIGSEDAVSGRVACFLDGQHTGKAMHG